MISPGQFEGEREPPSIKAPRAGRPGAAPVPSSFPHPPAAGRPWATRYPGFRHAESPDSNPPPLAVLDRPRRHLHRRRGPPPRRHARHAQAAVRQPRAVPRRGRRRHPPPAGPAGRRADHARAGRVREDGHHGGHQRAAGAQGRADAAGHHARLSRRAAHRLPEPPAPVRPPHRAARAAVQRRDRGAGARRRARRGDRSRWTRRTCARSWQAAHAPRPAQRGHRLHARLPLHGARAGRRPARARGRLHAGQHLARDQPDDEVRQPRRHHGGRCLPVADPAPLRRAGGGRDAGREAVLHAVVRRPDRCPCLPGQGRDPVRARPAASSAWCARRSWRATTR